MNKSKYFRTFALAVFLMTCLITISAYAQTCNNLYSPSGNVSFHSVLSPKALTLGGNVNCSDVAFQLRYDQEFSAIGILALATPGNFNTYSTLSANSDFILSAIVAKEILVEITASKWADFVFDDDYVLMPIPELENSIKTNGKLPDIPSAQEVNDKGIDLANMDAKLLQKIEELTLYVIQLNKDNIELKREVQKLRKEIGGKND